MTIRRNPFTMNEQCTWIVWCSKRFFKYLHGCDNSAFTLVEEMFPIRQTGMVDYDASIHQDRKRLHHFYHF